MGNEEEEDLGMLAPVDQKKKGWKKLSITVDSGAVDHVTTKRTGDKLGTMETEASKKGMHYRAANGSQIKNHGACEAKNENGRRNRGGNEISSGGCYENFGISEENDTGRKPGCIRCKWELH